MNDLPQNELFSAYLDGELSAAEQAEMERLLATSPAARQLIEELRALSTTLQALPQEKLGEDLSRQVLRVAERRMLTGAEPGPTEASPTPLGRSIFRQFFNRRAVVWLSLTAAIALVIVINEQRQSVRPAVEVARRSATTPVASDKRLPRKPGPPPTIQAAHDDEHEPLKEAKVAVEERREAERSSGSALTAERAAGSAPPPAPAEKPADLGRQTTAPRGYEGLLVVQCDISPEGVQRRALPQLLVANGVAWNEQPAEQRRAEKAKEEATAAVIDGMAGQATLLHSIAAGKADVLYAEATTAQIDATLAGLRAQPNVFLSYSLSRMAGGLPPELADRLIVVDAKAGKSAFGVGERAVRAKAAAPTPTSNAEPRAALGRASAKPKAAPPTVLEFQQRVQVAGPQAGRGAVGQLDVTVRERTQSQPGAKRDQDAVTSFEARPRANEPAQQPQSVQPSPRQRVLFVLNVVGGKDHSPAATKAGTGVAADAVKPSEPAASPAAPPPARK